LASKWVSRTRNSERPGSVVVARWRCKLTIERAEGAVVRCSKGGKRVAWYRSG
jgi:hypothetical protein